MASTAASRRYAKALFALCREQQAVDAVRSDLEALASLMHTSPEWKAFVTTPVGTRTIRRSAIDLLLGGKTHALTQRFVAFLDSKGRLGLLEDIVRQWIELMDADRNILQATVTTASPLAANQLEALTKRLSARLGKSVILNTQLDASLIGGMKILVGDQVLDYSIETQLEQLQKRMIYA